MRLYNYVTIPSIQTNINVSKSEGGCRYLVFFQGIHSESFYDFKSRLECSCNTIYEFFLLTHVKFVDIIFNLVVSSLISYFVFICYV